MKKLGLLFTVIIFGIVSAIFGVSASTVLSTSISLPAQIVIYEGDLLALNPTFSPANTTDKSFTVTGSDYTYSYKSGLFGTKSDTCKFDSYISISTNGFLKAKKETVQPKGDKKEFSFTVTVTTTNGKTATTQVTVKPRMMTISYNGMEDNPWYYGNSVPLSVGLHSDIDSKYADSDISYKSSNTSVATVTSGGVVNCKGAGEAIITAETKDKKYSTTYEIYIRSVVALEKSYFEACQVGKTYQIKASILPSDSDDILMYYSLNEDVATVAAGGLVTFHKSGNALIAVTTSSDPYNYKQVWLTSGTNKAPTGSNAQLLTQMKTVANSAKTMTDSPNVMIKEKHIFENLKASTTTGTSTDISSLESTIESIFKPITTFLTAGSSTKDDFIKNIPVRNQSYVIASGLSESDIQSIEVTDNGEYYYEMTMTLKEEILSSLPTNPANTRHGKVFEIITQSLYDELKAKTDLNPSFDSITFNYHDSTLTLKVNKITGNLENATYNMTTDASVKSFKLTTLIPALNASATYNNVITVDFSGYHSSVCQNDHCFTDYIFVGGNNCITDGKLIAKCDNCDITNVIPTKGEHKFSENYTVDTYPSCDYEGVMSRHCIYCTAVTEVAYINKLPHAYKSETVAPTCTDRGYTYYVCECGDIYKDNYVDANGHIYEDYISDGNATCITDGIKTAVCHMCGKIDYILEKGDHLFSCEWTIDKEPTCKSEGTKSRHCIYCSEVTDKTSVDKIAHNYNIITIDPTCTDRGHKIYTCTCGDNYTETIPAKGHNLNSSVCLDCSYVCTCNCHKTGISAIIWKILSFFYKIFKTNSVCTCGVAHY